VGDGVRRPPTRPAQGSQCGLHRHGIRTGPESVDDVRARRGRPCPATVARPCPAVRARPSELPSAPSPSRPAPRLPPSTARLGSLPQDEGRERARAARACRVHDRRGGEPSRVQHAHVGRVQLALGDGGQVQGRAGVARAAAVPTDAHAVAAAAACGGGGCELRAGRAHAQPVAQGGDHSGRRAYRCGGAWSATRSLDTRRGVRSRSPAQARGYVDGGGARNACDASRRWCSAPTTARRVHHTSAGAPRGSLDDDGARRDLVARGAVATGITTVSSTIAQPAGSTRAAHAPL